MNADDLLAIDVDAEIAKITESRFGDAFEAPAALVRRALIAGARRVDVHLQRGRITVIDDGPAMEPADLERLDTVLDTRAPSPVRHAALVALENARLVDLLCARIVRPRRRSIVREDGRTRIALEGARYDRRAAADWLRTVAIHASADVRLDGAPLDAGFADPLATAALPPPLSGRVALVPGAESARIHVLGGGLVAGHLSLTGSLPFEAAIAPGDTSDEADAAALRRALLPHLDAVTVAARALLVETATRAPSLPRREALALAHLVLRAIRDDGRSGVLRGLKVLPARIDGGRHLTWLSLDSVAGLAGPSGQVAALDPGEPHARYALGAEPVLLLDAAARALAASKTNLAFVPPPLRRTNASAGDRMRAALAALGRILRAASDRLRHPLAPVPLGDEALDPRTRRVLALLRDALVPAADLDAVRLCRGDGPIRESRRRLHLPEGNPTVVAALRVLAEDPTWLHPAAVALLGPSRVPRAVRASFRPGR
jgi:hypothetical protein